MADNNDNLPQPQPIWPAPITVRLINDPPVLLNPPPFPEAGVPVPLDALNNVETTSAKKDDFYNFWDRFLNEDPSGRNVKNKRRNVGKNGIVSLDTDPEGRPAHLTRLNSKGVVATQGATTSYDEAVATCRAKVRAIVNECTRLNVKYTDKAFLLPSFDALVSLDSVDDLPSSLKGMAAVGSAKRVTDIFEKPEFFIDGATANDVRQGRVGDCWFLAAITALTGKKDLIEKICVDRDERVGVYGFVFFRDGEWVSEVVDDHLALSSSDDQMQFATEYLLSVRGTVNVYSGGITNNMKYGDDYDILKLPKEFKEGLRKGSKSLYFASCREGNETWLPLLEKAYAKVHGDYQAIEGGFTGEGIEDLTGGVSTYISSETVLDKDRLWSELMQANQDSGFLFGCGSRFGRDFDPSDDEGFVRGHAYTVLNAREVKDSKDSNKTIRLLKIRNPWGTQEWNGPWSDGSKEWTAQMITELDHTFGDDGIFWISFQDWLKYFPDFERTKLFGPEWTVSQQWTTVNVPWRTEYLDGIFSFSLAGKSPVVLVLSQPDRRYFSGLQGRYRFDLQFRLYKEGEQTYIVRSMLGTGSGRSCSAELELEAGTYSVHIKVETSRWEDDKTPEKIIKQYRTERRDKLLMIGKNFDLAHSKGRLRDREEQNAKARKAAERKEEIDGLKRERVCKKIDRERERARNKRNEAERKRKIKEKKAQRKKEQEQEEESSAAAASAAAAGDAKGTGGKELAVKEKEASPEAKQELLSPPASTIESAIGSPSDIDTAGEQSKTAEKEPTLSEDAAKEANTTDQSAEEADQAAGSMSPQQKEEEDVSDVSSVIDDDFSWDDEIDGPADIDTEEEDEPGLYANDPWNAKCVLGLRVYSTDKTMRVKVDDALSTA